jgi:hypothetical protein
LSYYECERIIDGLEVCSIEEYGSLKWLRQHKQYSRLNVQAHINAHMRGDEYVMESFATLDKVGRWSPERSNYSFMRWLSARFGRRRYCR